MPFGEDFVELKGAQPGPISVVLVGVHGDDVSSIAMLEAAIATLSIQKGTVFFGVGNHKAAELKIRSVGADLDRLFRPDMFISDSEKATYEYARAQILKTVFDKTEALLDIRTSTEKTSRPFVAAEQLSWDTVKYLPFNHVLTGFDVIQQGDTDYYMHMKGKIGIRAECGYIGNPETAQLAKDTLEAFLVARGHMQGTVSPGYQSHVQMYMVYTAKTSHFALTKPYVDFDNIPKGQFIGLDQQEVVHAPKDSVILFARTTHKEGAECFMLGEYKGRLNQLFKQL
jgi:hypothetical protein